MSPCSTAPSRPTGTAELRGGADDAPLNRRPRPCRKRRSSSASTGSSRPSRRRKWDARRGAAWPISATLPAAAREGRNLLARALQEYGRLIETNFIPAWRADKQLERRVTRQLNKGGALHALRRYLFLAREGQPRHRHLDEHGDQALCSRSSSTPSGLEHRLQQAALDQLAAEGHVISNTALAHVWSCSSETRRPPRVCRRRASTSVPKPDAHSTIRRRCRLATSAQTAAGPAGVIARSNQVSCASALGSE
jgi:hypothetical protein